MPAQVITFFISLFLIPDTGGFSTERVSPKYVALHPPDDLELEVIVTGYEAVTWLINGTVMHDFERLLLQDNNQKLVITNTSTEDYGTYTADIHTLENEPQVIMIDFFVHKYGQSMVVQTLLFGSVILFMSCRDLVITQCNNRSV